MAESFSNHEFAVETWTEYGVGIFLILTRLLSQARRLGVRNLRKDDWVMVTVIPWYTLLVVSINKIIFGGGSNFMTPEEIATMTPAIHASRVQGSKWVLLSEEVMVMTIWTCKICMLLIYSRLTEGLDERRIINAVFIYVAAGFVGTQIALFTTCRPFSAYWSVPAINYQCWSYYNFEIVEATFNVSADLMVLLVAIPLLMKLRVPIQQKVILIGVFGMGLFVIVAAILTKVYSLDPNLVSYAYLNWYFREASVSVYVSNAPALWALIRDLFPRIRHWGYPPRTSDLTSYGEGARGTGKVETWGKGSNRTTGAGGLKSKGSNNDDTMELFDRLDIENSHDNEVLDIGKMESQERIIPQDPMREEEDTRKGEPQNGEEVDSGLKIYKDVSFSITESARAPQLHS